MRAEKLRGDRETLDAVTKTQDNNKVAFINNVDPCTTHISVR